jgi:predicted membrane protein
MDIQDSNGYYRKRKNENRVLVGVFLFLIGGALLLNEIANQTLLPHWLFTWPMILIVVGIFSGIRCQFRGIGWIFPLVIGLIFLTDELGFDLQIHRYLVPFFIIFLGIILILRPRGNRFRKFYDPESGNPSFTKPIQDTEGPVHFNAKGTEEDYFHSTSIFGGAKKVILSKGFKGAEITCIFGGCEIDLSNADLKETALINLTFLFGGGKIIVPSDWQVRFNVVPIFGGIDDKRNQAIAGSQDKILIIEGTCIFGGLDVSNFSGVKDSGYGY